MCACTPVQVVLLGSCGCKWVELCVSSLAMAPAVGSALRCAALHCLASLPHGGLIRCSSLGCAGLVALGLCWMRGCAMLIGAVSHAHHTKQKCPLCGTEDAGAP